MESAGEEKKLQALFSELKAVDEETAPRFTPVWNRAQLSPRRMRAFNPAFVAAAALLVCALLSLAVWSRYARSTPKQPLVMKNETAPQGPESVTLTPAAAPLPENSVKANVKPPEIKIATRANRLTTRRNAQVTVATRKLTQDAKTISNWQSPTSALLSSPSAELFNSLPQLNESATQLKSFLPNSPN